MCYALFFYFCDKNLVQTHNFCYINENEALVSDLKRAKKNLESEKNLISISVMTILVFHFMFISAKDGCFNPSLKVKRKSVATLTFCLSLGFSNSTKEYLDFLSDHSKILNIFLKEDGRSNSEI